LFDSFNDIKRIDMTTGKATVFSTGSKWSNPYIGTNGEVSAREQLDALHTGFQTRITLAQLASGVVNTSIDFFGSVLVFFSQIVISPDSQLLAFELRPGPATADIPVTRIVRRDGKVVGEYPGLGQPSWTSDQRLIMCAGNKIYRSGVESTTALTKADVVATLPATPTSCKASAQGDKVALRMDAQGCIGDRPLCPDVNGPLGLTQHLWVVNLDGTGLRQLTTSRLAISHGESAFAWSPDGKFMAAVVLNCGSDPLNTQPICTNDLHVVPSDADKIELLNDDAGKVVDSKGFEVQVTGDISWR
jgi:hypothetical protein